MVSHGKKKILEQFLKTNLFASLIKRSMIFTIGLANLRDSIAIPPDTIQIDEFISDPAISSPGHYCLKAQIVHVGNSDERGS